MELPRLPNVANATPCRFAESRALQRRAYPYQPLYQEGTTTQRLLSSRVNRQAKPSSRGNAPYASRTVARLMTKPLGLSPSIMGLILPGFPVLIRHVSPESDWRKSRTLAGITDIHTCHTESRRKSAPLSTCSKVAQSFAVQKLCGTFREEEPQSSKSTNSALPACLAACHRYSPLATSYLSLVPTSTGRSSAARPERIARRTASMILVRSSIAHPSVGTGSWKVMRITPG